MIRTSKITGIVCAVACTLSACDSDIPYATGNGGIAPSVSLSSDVVSASRASTTNAIAVSADQLALTLTAKNGTYSNHWASVNDFDTKAQFGVGSYIMTATYSDPATEGFEQPAYAGSAEFTVKENQTTSVALTATLANSMVSVSYTDAFKNYMSDWSAELHTTGGQYWTYAKDETRPIYLAPGATTLSVSVTKPNGVAAKLQVANFTTVARHHYKVLVDLTGGAGDVVMTVTFDDTTVADNVSVDLSDELLAAPAPVINATGFANNDLLNFITGTNWTTPVKMSVIGHSKLASAKLTTSGTALLADGFPAEVDLVNPGADKAKLTALGFNVLGLWTNPDKMAILDFTKLINNIRNIEGDDNLSQFTLVVTDIYGKVSDAMSFKVLADALKAVASSPSVIQQYDDELTFKLNYNGSNPGEELEFQYKNDRGTWTDANVVSINAVSRSGVNYSVTIEVPANENAIELRVANKNNNDILSTLTVERATPAVTPVINDVLVFAKSATLNGTLADNTVTGATVAYRKKGDTAWTNATATVSGTSLTAKISGLTPGTEYEVIGIATDFQGKKIETFTTEAATQLPYSDMETWEGDSSTSAYYLGSSSSAWGTNNVMTTSQGASLLYCKRSGTVSTTDCHGGSKAALLSTIGWGSGNTAGLISACAMKYIDAGLLHLGSNRSERPSGFSDRAGAITTTDLDCGMEFASRPSAFSCYYKYTAKNSSDHGIVEVYVYDAKGNVLASGTKNLTATSSYTQVSIPLTYATGAAKAAKIYVKFLSTYDSSFLQKNSSYISNPSTSSGSTGSQLYIDDLSLTY